MAKKNKKKQSELNDLQRAEQYLSSLFSPQDPNQLSALLQSLQVNLPEVAFLLRAIESLRIQWQEKVLSHQIQQDALEEDALVIELKAKKEQAIQEIEQQKRIYQNELAQSAKNGALISEVEDTQKEQTLRDQAEKFLKALIKQWSESAQKLLETAEEVSRVLAEIQSACAEISEINVKIEAHSQDLEKVTQEEQGLTEDLGRLTQKLDKIQSKMQKIEIIIPEKKQKHQEKREKIEANIRERTQTVTEMKTQRMLLQDSVEALRQQQNLREGQLLQKRAHAAVVREAFEQATQDVRLLMALRPLMDYFARAQQGNARGQEHAEHARLACVMNLSALGKRSSALNFDLFGPSSFLS